MAIKLLHRGPDDSGRERILHEQVDEAFVWLEQAFQQRNGWLIHIRENPRYDRLRADARYLDLVRRMNFPERERTDKR